MAARSRFRPGADPAFSWTPLLRAAPGHPGAGAVVRFFRDPNVQFESELPDMYRIPARSADDRHALR